MPKITGTGTPSVGVPVPAQEFDQGKFFNNGEKEGGPSSPGDISPASEPDAENEEETGRDLFPAEPDPPFNPTELSVPDVLLLKDSCTEAEWALVLDAERAGKARAGILGK